MVLGSLIWLEKSPLRAKIRLSLSKTRILDHPKITCYRQELPCVLEQLIQQIHPTANVIHTFLLSFQILYHHIALSINPT